jgi:hypothetical protein
MENELVLLDRYKALQQRVETQKIEIANKKAKRQSLLHSKKVVVNRLSQQFGIKSKEELVARISSERNTIINSCNSFISSITPYLNQLASSNKVSMLPPNFFNVRVEELDINNLISYYKDLCVFQSNVRSYLDQSQGMIQAMLSQNESLMSSIRQKYSCENIAHAESILEDMKQQMSNAVKSTQDKIELVESELANVR